MAHPKPHPQWCDLFIMVDSRCGVCAGIVDSSVFCGPCDCDVAMCGTCLTEMASRYVSSVPHKGVRCKDCMDLV